MRLLLFGAFCLYITIPLFLRLSLTDSSSINTRFTRVCSKVYLKDGARVCGGFSRQQDGKELRDDQDRVGADPRDFKTAQQRPIAVLPQHVAYTLYAP